MILRDGKFYENGKEVPPQIGNMEQIRLLKEAERKANGDSNALQFMHDALDIIKEVMSK